MNIELLIIFVFFMIIAILGINFGYDTIISMFALLMLAGASAVFIDR